MSTRKTAEAGHVSIVHPTPWRPTPAQLAAATGATLRDLIRPDLKVLFCGINPGLYSGAVGHHFARPGNRFWPVLHAGGFTARVLSPFEEAELLRDGYGITNVVPRTTARADELSPDELVAGAATLRAKVLEHRPRVLALLGVGAYRVGFGVRKATTGPQTERIGTTRIWVLPNPSGLNAHYHAADLGRLFRELHDAVSGGSTHTPPI